MRNYYNSILKTFFYENLVRTRASMELTQEQMADLLAMGPKSYIALDHGKSSCSALTFVRFLLYCCPDQMAYLTELREAFEKETDHAG